MEGVGITKNKDVSNPNKQVIYKENNVLHNNNKGQDKWLETTDNVTLTSLLSYIKSQGGLRDAQVETIKTYLYLKIECENKPLGILYLRGQI